MRVVLLWLCGIINAVVFANNFKTDNSCAWRVKKVEWPTEHCRKVQSEYERLHSSSSPKAKSNWDSFFFEEGAATSDTYFPKTVNFNYFTRNFAFNSAHARCYGLRFISTFGPKPNSKPLLGQNLGNLADMDDTQFGTVYTSFTERNKNLVSFINGDLKLDSMYGLDRSRQDQVVRLYFGVFEVPYLSECNWLTQTCGNKLLFLVVPGSTISDISAEIDKTQCDTVIRERSNVDAAYHPAYYFRQDYFRYLDVQPSPSTGDFLGAYSGSVQLGVKVFGQRKGGQLRIHGSCNARSLSMPIHAGLDSIHYNYHGYGYLFFAIDPCGPIDASARMGFYGDDKIAYPKCVDAHVSLQPNTIPTKCWSPQYIDVSGKYCWGKVSWMQIYSGRICGTSPGTNADYPNGIGIPNVKDMKMCCDDSDICHRNTRRYWGVAYMSQSSWYPIPHERTLAVAWRQWLSSNSGADLPIYGDADRAQAGVLGAAPDVTQLSVKIVDGATDEISDGEFFLPLDATPTYQLDYSQVSICHYLNVQVEFTTSEGRVASYQHSWHVGIYQGLTMAFFSGDTSNSLDTFFSADPFYQVHTAYENIAFDRVDVDIFLPEDVILTDDGVGILFSGSLKTVVSESCTFSFIDNADDKKLLIGGRDPSEAVSFVANQFTSYDFRIRVNKGHEFTFIMKWDCPSHSHTSNTALYEYIRTYSYPSRPDILANMPSLAGFDFAQPTDGPRIVEREAFFTVSYPTPGIVTYFPPGSHYFYMRLKHNPHKTIVLEVESSFHLSDCSFVFTERNYNVYQAGVILFDVDITDVPDSELGVRITRKGDDTVTKWLPISRSADALFRTSTTELGCFVSIDGSVRSYQYPNSITGSVPRQIEGPKDATLFDSERLVVQARVEPCTESGAVCVVGASIMYWDDVYSVYATVGDSVPKLHHKGFTKSRSPFLLIKEDAFGCWEFSTLSEFRMEVCVVDSKFLDIFIHAPSTFFSWGPDPKVIHGFCAPTLNPTTLYPEKVLMYFPEQDPKGWKDITINQIDPLFVPRECPPRVDEARDALRNVISFPPRSLSSTKSIFIPVSAPNNAARLCATSYAMANFAGDRSMLAGELGNVQLCRSLMDSGHEQRNAIQSANQLLYSIMRYIQLGKFVSATDWRRGMHDTLVQNNPHLCGAHAKATGNGCKCKVGSNVFPNCDGDRYTPQAEITFSDPCTQDVSVLIDIGLGTVYKCFKGDCQFTRDKISWRGMQKNLHTPYCLNAISWDDDRKETGQKLWATTSSGIQVMSTDGGSTWKYLAHEYQTKTRYDMAHVDMFDNVSPAKKGAHHSAPGGFNSFAGEGSDLWWLTPTDLCVQSDSISALHSSMVSCSSWYCDCVDADAWIASFGIISPP